MELITNRDDPRAREDVKQRANLKYAVLQHGNQDIGWTTEFVERTNVDRTEESATDIFEQLNGYWASLPPEKQNAIYNIYFRIKRTFYETDDSVSLTKALQPLIAQLLEYHNLEDILHWIDFKSMIKWPTMAEKYDTEKTGNTPDKTYLKEEYRWLVAMSIALRAVVPVWGEFLFRTRRASGTTWKEYYAFLLLSKSNLYHHPAMEKLRRYVASQIPTDKTMPGAIIGGISSEDFPTWVLALVVVRRVVVGDIRGMDPAVSLVTFIFRFIHGKVRSQDNSFVGMVKDKTPESQSGDNESNLSKLEGYKVKQESSQGDIESIDYYAQQVEQVAKKICPDIDLGLVFQSLEQARKLSGQKIWDPQLALAQWVIKPAISPRALLYLKSNTVLTVMAIAQACLWHRGYHDLAALVLARAVSNEDELQLNIIVSQARIPDKKKEELDALYPYQRRAGGKQKQDKQKNPAVLAIESIAKGFKENVWSLSVPEDWLERLNMNSYDRRFAVPSDIKVKLAELVTAVAKRSF